MTMCYPCLFAHTNTEEMTTKRSKVWNPATRRYHVIEPIKHEYQTELQTIWLNYHYLKED
jgi:hypothetical protein